MVDPYGVWRAVEIPGFNAAKSERLNLSHVFKPADLRRTLPPYLILGSSRSAFGLNPEHPAVHVNHAGRKRQRVHIQHTAVNRGCRC